GSRRSRPAGVARLDHRPRRAARGTGECAVEPGRRHGGRDQDAQMTTVFLVDDHAMFRAGVRAELGQFVQLVGEAGTVADAIAGIRERHPDVVLLDVHMPDGGGLAVLAGVAAEVPDTRFLALSVSDAAEDVIAVIRAGARGYVTKTISSEDLADAVRRVNEGDAVVSPRLAGFVLDAFRVPTHGTRDPGPVT